MHEIRIANYAKQRSEIERIRVRVFVEEQGVPPELEMDELDEDALHLLAWRSGVAVGTARLTPDGHIGRVAVLPEYRGQHIGRSLMEAMMELATQSGRQQVEISAQIQAKGFYHSLGFQEKGDAYMEAGIPHIAMSATL